jgi:DNA replicative helicase MCM subunit Mcm2 (Cdc46/Mcm family)
MVSLRTVKRKSNIDLKRKRNYAALTKNKLIIDPNDSKVRNNQQIQSKDLPEFMRTPDQITAILS